MSESKVATSGGVVRVVERGAGPAVLLLHAALHSLHDYELVMAGLSSRYRTVALDWPAHGRSSSSGPVSAPLFADVLREVVESLQLERAVVIGNSVGGYAAARLAIDRPERVAGLVLVNTGGFAAVGASRTMSRVLGSERVAGRLLPAFVHGYMRANGEFDTEVRRRVVGRSRTRAGVATAAQLWRSFADPRHDLRASAHQITAPTLVVWGSRDLAIPLRYGKATHGAIPGSRFVTLPTGHVPFASKPLAFLAEVLDFLDSLPGSRSTWG
jgi:pimeloyl-ACP methyl ester carboxylesterase